MRRDKIRNMHSKAELNETEEMVTYCGRAVPRRGFRAYIYSKDGRQKIAENWDEFDAYTHSTDWFATVEEANNAASHSAESEQSAQSAEKVDNEIDEIINKRGRPKGSKLKQTGIF